MKKENLNKKGKDNKVAVKSDTNIFTSDSF